jgi:hypothetical protein
MFTAEAQRGFFILLSVERTESKKQSASASSEQIITCCIYLVVFAVIKIIPFVFARKAWVHFFSASHRKEIGKILLRSLRLCGESI